MNKKCYTSRLIIAISLIFSILTSCEKEDLSDKNAKSSLSTTETEYIVLNNKTELLNVLVQLDSGKKVDEVVKVSNFVTIHHQNFGKFLFFNFSKIGSY